MADSRVLPSVGGVTAPLMMVQVQVVRGVVGEDTIAFDGDGELLTGLDYGCMYATTQITSFLASSQSRAKTQIGHRFGKVGVLATMPGDFHPKKLKWTSNAD